MRVLTVEQVATRWKCCRLTVLSKIKSGQLKYFKLGREYRTREDWLEEYENNNILIDSNIHNELQNS